MKSYNFFKKLSFCGLLFSFMLLSSCSNNPVDNPNGNDNPTINHPIDDNDDVDSDVNEDEDKDDEKEDIELVKDEEGFYKVDKKDLSYGNNSSSNITYESEIDYETSTNLRLYENGNQIPLYLVKTNGSQTFTQNNYSLANNSVGYVRADGKINLVLQTNFTLMRGITIRPLEKEIPYEIDQDKRLIYFTIEEAGQYTIEFRTNATLHLFVDRVDLYKDKPKENLMIFEKGLHTKDNDSRINSNSKIYLNSNTNVYIEYGAVIEGGFVIDGKTNINIYGGGIISGANFVRDAATGQNFIPWEISNSSNIRIEGITNLDPAGWCYNLYFSHDLYLDNIKIISSRANGDGVSVQSCQNVSVSNSFVRSWDDSLVVKNYPVWNSDKEGYTNNIHFENCLIWTDLAQSLEIGFETIGDVMENIYFKDITILHANHKAAISIHNANNSNVRNVHYDNIVIEDASPGRGDGNRSLIEISTLFSTTWSTNHKVTALGEINDIYLNNITVLDGNSDLEVNILGCIDNREAYKGSKHYVNGVHFNNVVIKGEKLSEDYKYLSINEYTSDITFE